MRNQPDPRAGKVYRGRRRLPKLPSRRYAAVIATAIMGAAVVALGSTAIVPDDLTASRQQQSLLSISGWLEQGGSKTENQAPAVQVDSSAPDVWLLPMRYPYQITSLFGPRWGRIHWGTDMGAPMGTPIYAVHDGVVTDSSYESGYGLHLAIDHGQGVKIIYAHASELLVGVGHHVHAGDMIARVGSTGNSTGPHLHFEVHVHEGFFDAQKFMREHGVDLATHQEVANGGTVL